MSSGSDQMNGVVCLERREPLNWAIILGAENSNVLWCASTSSAGCDVSQEHARRTVFKVVENTTLLPPSTPMYHLWR